MSEETIFSEVDEELRSERMRNLWHRFGPWVIGAAVAVVLLVAANEGWRWYQTSNASRSSDLFYTAVDLAGAGDIEGAKAALRVVVAEGSGQYPLLAQFRQASLLVEAGDADGAVAAYDALATSLSNQRMRDMALLMAAYVLVDKPDVAAVEARISGLIAPGNPLRNVAREALGLAHYATGDINAARAQFEQIAADPLGSLDGFGRIQVYLQQLIAEGATAPDAVSAE